MNRKIKFLLVFLLLSPFLTFSQSVFINEINHVSPDMKGLEIAGPVNTDLNGWTLSFYDVSGVLINTIPLSSTIPNPGTITHGFIWIDVVMGLQENNGGIGLTNDSGMIVQFLSYGGSPIVASSGLLLGTTSTDIGIAQSTDNESIQLAGTGYDYNDFDWELPETLTEGIINTNQYFNEVTTNNSSQNAILPIELLFFEGKKASERATELMWATAMEKDNDFFRIEHSIDGKDFEEIGLVDGAENSNQTLHYNFFHENTRQGINYYRFAQIDLDGKETYSPVVTVNIEIIEPTVQIYPNPVSEKLIIQMPFIENETGTIQLIDRAGKLITQVNFSDNNPLEFDVSNYEKGTYIIYINSAERTYSQLIVIK